MWNDRGHLSRFMRSADYLGPRGRRLWCCARSLVPNKTRFLYEGVEHIPGQLWYVERKALYSLVLSERPASCFEIGTSRGGGSTVFIASALRRLGGGHLFSAEVSEELWLGAAESFREHAPELLSHVNLLLGEYAEVFRKQLVEGRTAADLVFLDGAEDAQETLNQYEFFLPYFRPGSWLVIHDWNTEKAREVRYAIESAVDKWHIRRVLKPPLSVGMAFAQYL